MDSEDRSLQYIIEEPSCITKIALALSTSSCDIKKNLYEVLTALCAHNASGYDRVMAIIEYYKKVKQYRYRFKAVVEDLNNAETLDYQIVLLGFINYVIMTPTDFIERNKIRNEFIGLQILPIFKYLRKVADSVEDLVGQLDVFEENRECDEAQNQQNPNGINLNSHVDIFYSIFNQVSETPHEVIFLSLLQHLLRIDSKDAFSDVIWDAAEKMVHRATLLESNEDAARLLRTQSVQILPMANGRATDIATRFSQQQLHAHTENISQATATTTLPRQKIIANQQSNIKNNDNHMTPLTAPSRLCGGESMPPPPPPMPHSLNAKGTPPPPPPPPKPYNQYAMGPPPPPPPIPYTLNVRGQAPIKNSSNAMGPPPPPPPMPMNSVRPKTPEQELPIASLLPQQYTPEPKIKMKKLNWNKIPDIKVLGKNNIWTKIASNHDKAKQNEIDFAEMEMLFSNPPPGSPQLSADMDTTDRKTNRRETVALLDSRLILNTNIFIRQFRMPKSVIVDAIRKCDQAIFGLEKLQNLNKIIADTDFDVLRAYTGDRSHLDEAILFLMELMMLSGFKLRAAGMLLKEEFNSNISYLASSIDSMLCMGQDMMQNKLCEEILYLVVVSGNFINCGGYGGNAAGIRFSSLYKLNEVRSQNKNITLMHFIALQAKKQNPDLINFPHQFPSMEQSTKTTVEQITTELNQLETRVHRIKNEVEAPSTDMDIKENMLEFLEKAQEELNVLKTGLDGLDILRKKLAEFFCEDETAFTLEECFKTFSHFCNGMKQAFIDNEMREKKKLEADMRRKRAEDNKQAKRLAQENDPNSPMPIRRRMGSCAGIDLGNTNAVTTTAGSNVTATTPDLTPNGSLRRRINNRALPDEDELMQFLRTSGNEHISRERKAYGSLDRSWSRRSTSRKRHELLNADFSTDRERANSPVPQQILQQQQSLIDEKSVDTVRSPKVNLEKQISEPNEEHLQKKDITKERNMPRISHLWRSKIETWLLLNEIDNKQNDEYKRKRRMANEQRNRRSLENDAESERKLQTLPEEDRANSLPLITATVNKTTPITNNNYTKSGEPDTRNSLINEKYTKVHLDKSSNHNETLNTNTNKEFKANDVQSQQQEQHSKALPDISDDNRRRSLIQKLGEKNDDANEHIEMYVRRPRIADATINSPPQSPKIMRPPPLTTTSSPIMTTSDNNNIIEPKIPENMRNSKWILNNGPSKTNTTTTTTTTTAPVASAAEITTETTTATTNNEETCNFDRYAVERRTRRFKRAAESAACNVINSNSNEGSLPIASTSATTNGHNNDKNLNGCKYEENLQNIPINNTTNAVEEAPQVEIYDNNKISITYKNNNNNNNIGSDGGHKKNLEKIGRRFSSINQEDVQNAKRNLKSPTDHMSSDMRIWRNGNNNTNKGLNQHNDKNISIANVMKTAKNTKTRNWSATASGSGSSIKSTTGGISARISNTFILPKPHETTTTNNNKLTNNQNNNQHNHEQLNDEGFEETQSLVSDTPSNNKDINIGATTTTTIPTISITYNMPKLKNTLRIVRTNQVTKSNINRLADRLQTNKLRNGTTTPTTATTPTTSTSGVKSYNNSSSCSSSNRKSNINNSQQSKVQRADVRRTNNYRQIVTTASGSGINVINNNNSPRASLRSSSHSSINSANSINTVRRMPQNNNNIISNNSMTAADDVIIHRKNSNSSSISSGSNKKIDIGLKKPLKILQNYQQSWATTTMPMPNNNRITTTRPSAINRQSSNASTSSAVIQGNKMRKNNYNNSNTNTNNNRIGKIYNGASTTTTNIALASSLSSGETTLKTRNEHAGNNLASTSFKENQEQQQQQTRRAINGFMRPTTSSATKRHN